MYSSQKNIQVIISLLKQYGVSDIVISPGSRNMAIVRSVEGDPFFTTHSVVDERSASYFATGIWLKTGRPVALSCTSAQATRNYIPGMTEAYYRNAPLVFITSDYIPSIIHQGVMQAMDQMSIPKDAAKVSVNLPVVKDKTDHRYCVRLVNEALLELDHHGAGPVHINVPTEEHWTGGVDALPVAEKITRHTATATYPELAGKRILVVVGQHRPFGKEEQEALDMFSTKYNAVIYTSPLSNYSGPKSLHAGLFTAGMGAVSFAKYAPDVAITIGGQHGDYGIDVRLRGIHGQHWRVHEDGAIRDTYGTLTDVFESSIADFFTYYNTLPTADDNSYYELWRHIIDRQSTPEDLPLSHAYVASKLLPALPEKASVHFAILNSLRNWSFFDTSKIEGYSNVAGFGIDGCMSTFMGHAVASDDLTFLVIGDLSFFYDMNSIGIRDIKNNARIVLVNNAGGAEFRMYNNAANVNFGKDANKHIAAAGHFGPAGAWAKSVGWDYIEVTDKESFNDNLAKFTATSDKPILMEVFTAMEDDSDGTKLMVYANATKTVAEKVADTMSPKMKKRIKKILKR